MSITAARVATSVQLLQMGQQRVIMEHVTLRVALRIAKSAVAV